MHKKSVIYMHKLIKLQQISTKASKTFKIVSKLDGVGPVDNRPSPD